MRPLLLLPLFVACNPSAGPDADVTWNGALAPIVDARCMGCHEADGIAWNMEDPEVVVALSGVIANAVEQGTMPPFLAQETDDCEPPLPWKDDLRLTDDEKDLFRTWADNGAPLGDPATRPETPRASLDLADPSLTLTPSKAWVTSGSRDQFRCYSFDLGNDRDMWLNGTQLLPDQSDVVHHGLLFLDANKQSATWDDGSGSYECFGGPGLSETELVGAWAPGALPNVTPQGSATFVPAGARLVLQIHYHPRPDGTEVADATQVQLRWSEQRPTWYAGLALVGNFSRPAAYGGLQPGPGDPGGEAAFVIPAGATDHTETMTYRLENGPFRIWTVGTHMHYVGTDMRWTLQRGGDPSDETCMIETPDWDFGWQRGYSYDAPLTELPEAQAGDVIWMQCTYDNSLGNPFVRDALAEQGLDAPVDVYLGESTLDEMCLAVVGYAYPL